MTEISELTAAAAVASGDLLVITDVSDTTDSADGTSKRATAQTLFQTISYDVLPSSDGTRDLGSASLAWAEIHTDALFVGGTSYGPSSTPGADALWGYDLSATATIGYTIGNGLETSGTTFQVDETHTAVNTLTVNAQTGTSYTLALTDAQNRAVTMSNASANTVTVPTNASVAFPVGSIVNIIQIGAGATTITGDTGVTVNGTSAGSAAIQTQYQGAVLLKTATDVWVVSGDIA